MPWSHLKWLRFLEVAKTLAIFSFLIATSTICNLPLIKRNSSEKKKDVNNILLYLICCFHIHNHLFKAWFLNVKYANCLSLYKENIYIEIFYLFIHLFHWLISVLWKGFSSIQIWFVKEYRTHKKMNLRTITFAEEKFWNPKCFWMGEETNRASKSL